MTGLILVAGATGGVGQHLIGRLTAQDYSVRALVRDTARAEQLFAAQDRLTLVEGDTGKPITLPRAVVGAGAVICAIGAKAPVGDNSPEKVDYEGVRNSCWRRAMPGSGVSSWSRRLPSPTPNTR
ncbi:MAG: NAD(P)H-binding protein [Anaerolineae bacterium]